MSTGGLTQSEWSPCTIFLCKHSTGCSYFPTCLTVHQGLRLPSLSLCLPDSSEGKSFPRDGREVGRVLANDDERRQTDCRCCHKRAPRLSTSLPTNCKKFISTFLGALEIIVSIEFAHRASLQVLKQSSKFRTSLTCK